ncbi:hypothetical protein Moror_3152 [Moniliophthora roreri MCA 2997]|uniref:Uncharacterized protein n=2 Tax=Moniliophthora roreri TaxID=221103 RepID=V2WNY7_MONRO|nr:hypothetical protein Moror_3152 [Moniliophthora roreri MCA 2997]KAI3621408.1 hypothetical protein WG66_000006 [Moniliophthora roreri]
MHLQPPLGAVDYDKEVRVLRVKKGFGEGGVPHYADYKSDIGDENGKWRDSLISYRGRGWTREREYVDGSDYQIQREQSSKPSTTLKSFSPFVRTLWNVRPRAARGEQEARGEN